MKRTSKNHTRKLRTMKGGSQDLLNAASNGVLEKVQQLVEAGANINWKGKNDVTPLMMASQKGYLRVVEYLVQNGANIEDKDKQGLNSLLYATDKNRLNVVEYLLDKGANSNVTNKKGQTPLNLAISNNYEPMADLLIYKGANVNQADNFGLTPLLTASMMGNFEILKLLYRFGAKLDSVTKDGSTALFFASYSGNTEMVKFILGIINDRNYINKKPKKNRTALMWACLYRRIPIIDLLLEHGADPNIVDEDGESALLIAANYGYSDVVEKLLEHGANPNITGKDRETALFIAFKFDSSLTYGYTIDIQEKVNSVVEKLLEHGADPNIVGKDGETALFLAAKFGYPTVVDTFLKNNAKITKKIKDNMQSYKPEIQELIMAKIQSSLNSNSKPLNAPSKCFDPIAYNNNVAINENTTKEMAIVYIQDTNNATLTTGCLDEASLEAYKTLDEYVFYRCKDSVPMSSLSITKNSVEPTKYRLLNFDRRIYVKDSEAQKLEVGKQYILRPTNEPLGRIASHDIIFGSRIAVSAVHCGPADGSMIYKIYEVDGNTTGGRRKTRRRRKVFRK